MSILKSRAMEEKGKDLIIVRGLDVNQADHAFGEFMKLAESEMNLRASENPTLFREATPKGIEELSLQILREVSPKTPFRADEIILNRSQFFPDILAEQYYGVEVKCTKEDHWKSTGSSIVESTRTRGVERIYMMFGKLGGRCPEFKCKPYEECLVNIAVTHSPRYLINMNADHSDTIFAKIGINYDEFRSSDRAIEKVRKYYRERAFRENRSEMPWWIGSETEDVSTSVVLRLWADLSKVEQDKLRTYVFLLFPEVLNSEYKNVALWLCTRFSILVHNARDAFSAGGQYKSVGGVLMPTPIPHIIGELIHSAGEIKKLLNNLPEELKSDIELYREELLVSPRESWLSLVQEELRKMVAAGRLPENFPFNKWFEEEVRLSLR